MTAAAVRHYRDSSGRVAVLEYVGGSRHTVRGYRDGRVCEWQCDDVGSARTRWFSLYVGLAAAGYVPVVR